MALASLASSPSSLASSNVFCSRASIRKRLPSAETNLCFCINRILATSAEPERNINSPLMGVSLFQRRSLFIPNLLRSYAFDPKSSSSSHMSPVENDPNEVESSKESSEEKKVKGTSWFETLVEFGRTNWNNLWQKKGATVSVTHNSSDEERRSRSDERDVFSRFLVKVPWSDTKLYSQLAFLCNLAYSVTEINAKDLYKYYGLQFVTSSSLKEAQASAAAYFHLLSKAKKDDGENHVKKFTTLVSEESDEETVKDMKLLNSLPCEWFVCDDPNTYKRIFVFQGIDSLASWQAYFLFECIEFEGTSVLVHRGAYELAKKLYKRFMPEIMNHLARHGEKAKLQFTGHCLGGSLAVIFHLMLLTRKVVMPSTLLPVVTFGSPYVFCGGQKIFEQLGLDECNQIHSVMLHRDIFPRSFSSIYPDYIRTLLKRLHASFKSHYCPTQHKILYSPMGKLLIVQPDESSSPPHPLLPLGNALYALDNTQDGFSFRVLMDFLNSPHPLETLSYPSSYGSKGTILRDHDSINYLKAMNGVLRLHTKKGISVNSTPPSSWNHEDGSDIES